MSISLCMIAKDEEEYIEGSINSVKPIVDEIIIALDEKSRDNTEKIARELGAKVYVHKWKDDFSDARNFSISKATKEWILVLDADETISKKDLDLIKKLTENKKIMAYSFIQRTYTNDTSLLKFQSSENDTYEESKKYRGWTYAYLIRLFQKNKDIEYKGEVHENILDSLKRIDGKIEATLIPIHHYGKLKKDVGRKSRRYLKLGKKKAEKTGDAKSYRELAIQQHVLGRLEDSVENFKKAIELEKNNVDDYINLGSVYIKLKKLDEAIEIMEKGTEIEESADLYNNLGVAYERAGKNKAAVESFKKSILLKERPETHFNMARIYLKQGLTEDVIKILSRVIEISPDNVTAYNNLEGIYLQRGEYDKAIETLKKLRELQPGRIQEIDKKIRYISYIKDKNKK